MGAEAAVDGKLSTSGKKRQKGKTQLPQYLAQRLRWLLGAWALRGRRTN